MTHLTLKSELKKARVLRGHPWVFAGEIVEPVSSEWNGKGIELKDARGRSLGWGIYNNQSQIIWRRYSQSVADFDETFLRMAIPRAIARRAVESFRRLVWSETDDIPGLVVDQYGEVLVVQALTLAVDLQIKLILSILNELLSPQEIIIRNDSAGRRYEGLPVVVDTFSGQPYSPTWVTINGIEYFVDLMTGHKTGFYLDQRTQHTEIAAIAKDRRVLDGFCNQGAFALNCLKAGASSVIGVDYSQACIDLANKNAERNALKVDFRCENMFDYFTNNRQERFGLIILDPPSFARNKTALPSALRGYKELNLRALQMLEPGGYLATYSCSQHVTREVFDEVLQDAAVDSRRRVRVIRYVQQSSDHPIELLFAESEYLNGCILQVR
jgi:23S rRNA (cytosine1962-C5)-methyltransferase